MEKKSGSYDLKNEDEARQYLKNIYIEYSFQCYHEKLPDGCHRLAEFSESVRKEWDKAREIYSMNCIGNKHSKSCFKLGNYFLQGKAGTLDMGEALKFYEMSCNLGCGSGCHNAGLMYHDGKVVEKSIPKALEYMERGCLLKDMPSCLRAASYLIKASDGVTRDMQRARQYSEAACAMDLMPACANLSHMYAIGDGVDKNQELADKYRRIYDNFYTVLKKEASKS